MTRARTTLMDLANILATPYEEINITAYGEDVYHEEYDGTEQMRLVDDYIIVSYGHYFVEKVDCRYDGDHMVLDIALG